MTVDNILYLQSTAGNQAVQSLVESGFIQTKLRTNQSGIDSTVKAGETPGQQTIPHNTAVADSGRPLPESERTFFEQGFGHDFSGVRIHTNTEAARSAQEMNAIAYTVGENVVFGPGKYNPDTGEGKKLIAHELAHVVQQSNPNTGHTDMSTRKSAERQADSAAQQAVLGLPVALSPMAGAPSIQLKSLSGEYEDRIMQNIEKGNYVRGYLWTLLFTAHDALTFGFLSAHDPAYDAYEKGQISEDEYLKATLKATGRSVVIGGAVMATGGLASAAGEGLAVGLGAGARLAPVIGSTIGGASAGGAGQLTADLYDMAMGDRKGLSTMEQYLTAIGLGAFGGLILGGTVAGATRFKVFNTSAERMGFIYASRFPRTTKLLSVVRQGSAVKASSLVAWAGIRAPWIVAYRFSPNHPGTMNAIAARDAMNAAAARAYGRMMNRTANSPQALKAYNLIDKGQDWSGSAFGKALEVEINLEVQGQIPNLVYQRSVAVPKSGLTNRQIGGIPDWRLPVGGGYEAIFDCTMAGGPSVGKALTKYGQPSNIFIFEILYPRPPHVTAPPLPRSAVPGMTAPTDRKKSGEID